MTTIRKRLKEPKTNLRWKYGRNFINAWDKEMGLKPIEVKEK